MTATVFERNLNSEMRIYNNHMQRTRELRRRITIFVISVLLFIVLVIILSKADSRSIAADGSNPTLYKYYTTVEVKAGDSLTSISEDYVKCGPTDTSKFIREVMFINNIDNADKIVAGSVIVVPYYDVYRQ